MQSNPVPLSARSEMLGARDIATVMRAARQLADPLDLTVGEPDIPVPKEVVTAAVSAIFEGRNGYVPATGLPALTERLRADAVAEFGSQYDLDVLVTTGVTGGLLLALMATTDPGDEVIVIDPYFPLYLRQIEVLGVVPRIVTTYPRFRVDSHRISKAISPKTKAIILNSPNNPTGSLITDEEMASICKLARFHDLHIISDEIYRDFVYDGNHRIQSPGKLYERVLVLRGFSKSHSMTGWRLGYVIGEREAINRMATLQLYLYGCAPAPLQYGALRAINISTLQSKERYAANRDLVVNALSDSFDIVAPKGGFYLFAKVPGQMSGSKFCELARSQNLLILPGAAFSTKDTHFRMSFCLHDHILLDACNVLVSIALRLQSEGYDI
ncbi:MAG TPA: pyridoxal phosphate-dependent aminotransferase [Fimbriimonadaceae bacterium]|nr:pyridoxal phosphate-dependent aminotransferase [Fimbriimonadaceae bacterium]